MGIISHRKEVKTAEIKILARIVSSKDRDDMMLQLRKDTTWMVEVEPVIARDMVRAAEDYANAHEIELPAEEIKSLYERIDNAALDRKYGNAP